MKIGFANGYISKIFSQAGLQKTLSAFSKFAESRASVKNQEVKVNLQESIPANEFESIVESKKTTEIKDEYIPSTQSTDESTDQQTTIYKRKISVESLANESFSSNKHEVVSNLSPVDLASDEYAITNIEGEKNTRIPFGNQRTLRIINREPIINSLEKINEPPDLHAKILYQIVENPTTTYVPDEVKELGDWYVDHWNQISVQYVSTEGKVVSTGDQNLTREEQMKIYALTATALNTELQRRTRETAVESFEDVTREPTAEEQAAYEEAMKKPLKLNFAKLTH
jgi:hypothetical protein